MPASAPRNARSGDAAGPATTPVEKAPLEQWFLTTAERGNPFSWLDLRRGGASWSEGNRADLIVHGQPYFDRLTELVGAMGEGDLLLFTDWRGDPNERVADEGPTILHVLAGAARRGANVKGLFWRSHLDVIRYSEEQNRDMGDAIDAAGGEVLLDQRVLPFGSHHQKYVVLRHRDRPEDDVAFAGGIDMCHTRRDTWVHEGDPQAVEMGAIWGKTPAWHDAMVEIRGPAIGDIEASFRERWEDPTRLTIDPISRIDAFIHQDPEHAIPLPPQGPDPEETGDAAIQVLRTYPDLRPRYPFAPDGERSIARAYMKAVERAERIIYIEDQYFWSGEVTSCFAQALRTHPDVHIVIVLSTYTTANTLIANASAMGSRNEALAELERSGPGRVHVFGPENHESVPVYVHSKVCVVDDVWATVGSDNVNRRSWTHDSELTCAVVDGDTDPREPLTLREDRDPARVFAREARLVMAREHLDRADGDDADLVDPMSMIEAFEKSAAALEAWHDGGRRGARPPGRLRRYRPMRIPRAAAAVGRVVYDVADDPDGRPRRLRGTDEF